MKLAIVVGANGFLGSKLVDKLIDENYEVLAVYNRNCSNINNKAKIITNEEVLDLNINPNLIIYAVGNYKNSHIELLENNNLLYKYALKYKDAKFIYISSTNVYGSSVNSIVENSAYNNPGLYGISKLSGEFIVSSLSKYSIVRLTYIYGPGISNDSFLPLIIKNAKEIGTIKLFGEGLRKQDYIYIDDAVDFCLACALQIENGIFLGATGNSISNIEVAQEIKKGVDCDIIFSGQELGDSFYFNPEETFKKLNWFPRISFSEGLKKMLI